MTNSEIKKNKDENTRSKKTQYRKRCWRNGNCRTRQSPRDRKAASRLRNGNQDTLAWASPVTQRAYGSCQRRQGRSEREGHLCDSRYVCTRRDVRCDRKARQHARIQERSRLHRERSTGGQGGTHPLQVVAVFSSRLEGFSAPYCRAFLKRYRKILIKNPICY